MAVDFDTSATFEELLVEFCERAGIADHGEDGDQAAALPDDVPTLALAKRFVNRGYDVFMRSDRSRRWRWSFLQERLRIVLDSDGESPLNVDEDPARYQLPPYIQQTPLGNWAFVGAGVGWASIESVTHVMVERAIEESPATGVPVMAACRPVKVVRPGTAGDEPRGWELVLYPTPHQDYTIEADFRVRPPRLVEPGERHVAGKDHDHAILMAALYEWRKEDSKDDPSAVEIAKRDWDEALDASVAIDRDNTPKRRGRLTPTDQDKTAAYDPRASRLVRSINGIS